MSETSPTPWEFDRGYIYSGERCLAQIMPYRGDETLGPRMVQAVNCHAEMVEALRLAVTFLIRQREALGPSPAANMALSKIQSTLRKVEGTEAIP